MFLKNQTYVIAVSGGLDSRVLLDLLIQEANLKLIIAHLDHNQRPTSFLAAVFVQNLAREYDLRLELSRADLAPAASEAVMRQVRYDFLEKCRFKYQAQAIVTAHHQDDFLETVILNFDRGCGRRGLVSLKSQPQLLRPLINFSKKDLLDYAQDRQLNWWEDFSNLDLGYLRNYIRLKILNRFSESDRQNLLDLCQKLTTANQALDKFLDSYLKYQSYRRLGQVFSRDWFIKLDQTQSQEVVVWWLTRHRISYDRSKIIYIVTKLKELTTGKRIILDNHSQILITKRSLRLVQS